MLVIGLENLTFLPEYDKGDRYSCYAKYQGVPVAAIIGEIKAYQPSYVAMHTLQVKPEFRGNGIGKIFVEKLVVWTKKKEINQIKGKIVELELLQDTPERIGSYLVHRGFTVQGYDFWMNV
jgi:GNAT superfamily N-acetyltransferase